MIRKTWLPSAILTALTSVTWASVLSDGRVLLTDQAFPNAVIAGETILEFFLTELLNDSMT